MKKMLLFLLVGLFTINAQAQQLIKGDVIEMQSQNPVVEALFKLTSPNGTVFKTTSNLNGEFELSVDETGKYVLEVHKLGFLDYSENITVSSGVTKVQVLLEVDYTQLNSVEVSALRAAEDDPFAFTNLDKEDLAEVNNGRDIPYLLEQTPGLIATSDAGAGVGYTNMRIRGSDLTRINVTVNGIPMNDAESHSVWWVNTPDLVSSSGSVQVQRGVGTSSNGAGSFGATLNMQSGDISQKPFGTVQLGGGSFNTKRATVQLGTGMINDHWWVSGRLSKITSDGWVQRASSDLSSHAISAGYVNENTSIKAVYFGGGQKTYQAWNGVDSATLATDPTFNSAGAIYDGSNIVGYYDNETDNYKQDHYQLHWNQNLNEYWSLNLSGHYTYGRGYYEQYMQDQMMSDYNIPAIIIGSDTINSTDLIRQKWLDNDFYGGIYNLKYQKANLDFILGGGFHQYEGRHFGEVIWARYASDTENDHEYYRSYSNKSDFNSYAKISYLYNNTIRLFADLQVRKVAYRAEGVDDYASQFSFEQNNLFFNPKVGFNYMINSSLNSYFSYAVANKEPNRTDLIYADPNDLPKPENLQDIEAGVQLSKDKFNIQANLFYMYYKNQLVLTGEIDNVGYPIRDNIGRSYRSGIELIWDVEISKKIKWSANASFSQNRNLDLKEEQSDGTVKRIGNTNIAYSPNIVAASTFQFKIIKGFQVDLFSKYVGEQYLSNSDNPRHKLDPYFINDLRFSYEFDLKQISGFRIFANIQNMFDVNYVSNGYTWGPYPYYYPQAGLNLMFGAQIDF